MSVRTLAEIPELQTHVVISRQPDFADDHIYRMLVDGLERAPSESTAITRIPHV